MTTTSDHDTAAQPPSELPPFVFVRDTRVGVPVGGAASPAALPPTPEEAVRPRRWSSGHTVAAAVVAVGVLASGGAALAARDGSSSPGSVPGAPGAGTGIGQQGRPGFGPPAGHLPGGQLPGPLGGPGVQGGPGPQGRGPGSDPDGDDDATGDSTGTGSGAVTT